MCPNEADEVDRLIKRLNLSEVADKIAILSVKQGAKGKIPVFLPPGISIRQIFLYFSDIRTPPKKVPIYLCIVNALQFIAITMSNIICYKKYCLYIELFTTSVRVY